MECLVKGLGGFISLRLGVCLTKHKLLESYERSVSTVSTDRGIADGPIEPTKEDELWHRWCFSKDPVARDALSALYLPYAKALAARSYARRMHNEFEFDEYFHFAVVGMMESLERYVPGRGAHFKTFTTPRINGSILNGLDRLSERQQQIGLRRRMNRERLASLVPPDLSQDHEHRLLRELGDIGIGLALGFILDGYGMVSTMEDSLPDNAYAHIELKELRQQIWQLVDQLTAREAQVIRLHYLQEYSFDEICKTLQLTKGRISQLHRQGLERIRVLIKGTEKCNVSL